MKIFSSGSALKPNDTTWSPNATSVTVILPESSAPAAIAAKANVEVMVQNPAYCGSKLGCLAEVVPLAVMLTFYLLHFLKECSLSCQVSA